MFTTQLNNWSRRKRNLGDRAVGRRDESVTVQGERIEHYLNKTFDGRFFEHGLDFGCGWGRLTGLIAMHCGHLWCADLFSDWTARAAATHAVASPVVMKAQKLPLANCSMSLVVDIMTVQSIDNDKLARNAMQDLRRVAAPGATIISLHVNKPRSPTRTAAQRAAQLGLSNWKETVITDIDKANETYSYLIGTRI